MDTVTILIEMKDGRIINMLSTAKKVQYKILDHDLNYDDPDFDESPHDVMEIDDVITEKEMTDYITSNARL